MYQSPQTYFRKKHCVDFMLIAKLLNSHCKKIKYSNVQNEK